MENTDLVKKITETKLRECHVIFPSFGERSGSDLEIISRLFVSHLRNAGLSADDILAGFDHHIRTPGARFPTPGDIVGAVRPMTAYRLDYGPDGVGMVYAAEHPYVRRLLREGEDMGGRSIQVRACDYGTLATAAKCASDVPEIGTDPAPAIADRTGRGFKRIDYRGVTL